MINEMKSVEEKFKQDNKPLNLMDKKEARVFVENEFREMKENGKKRGRKNSPPL